MLVGSLNGSHLRALESDNIVSFSCNPESWTSTNSQETSGRTGSRCGMQNTVGCSSECCLGSSNLDHLLTIQVVFSGVWVVLLMWPTSGKHHPGSWASLEREIWLSDIVETWPGGFCLWKAVYSEPSGPQKFSLL